MHRTLSGWEYYILLKEAQPILHNRLSKAYETGLRQFRFDFGNFSLVIGIGAYFFITENPPQGAQTPTSLAMLMRKELGGKFIDSFKQWGNDRIYILEFSNGHKLILEQFSQGNMFLVDSQNRIIRPYSFKPTEKKIFKSGDEYKFAERMDANLLVNMQDWKRLQTENEQKSIASALGRLSFGKIYTNNILDKLAIGRDEPISSISDSQAQEILGEISTMQKSPQFLILKKGDAREISLMPLEGWEVREQFGSFSLALEQFIKEPEMQSGGEKKTPQKIRLEVRLEEQQRALMACKKKICELEAQAAFLKEHLEAADASILKARAAGEKRVKLK